MTTQAETDLCNAALNRLGEAGIKLTDTTSAPARACALALPMARAEVLRSHRWNFATRRKTLAPLETVPEFGYTHCYALPGDNLRVLEVNGVSGTGEPGHSWEIEGSQLLFNGAKVQLVYIADVPDLNAWDVLAREALTLLLAAKIAPMIQGGSTGKATELKQEFLQVVAPLARRVDANESRREGDNTMEAMLRGSHALAARGGAA